jgi:alpha-tubulin suppressor-like RCC1 family protein
VVSIAAGAYHSVALSSQGTPSADVWSWGYNNSGQVADGTITVDRPLPIRGLTAALSVHAERNQSQYLRSDLVDRAVWGAGVHNGTWLTNSTWQSATAPMSSTIPVYIAPGPYVTLAPGTGFSLALRRDTTVLVWGPNAATYPAANGLVLGYASGTDDPDGDGLTTSQEWALGTDAWNADTNGDGIRDGQALGSGKSATNPDMDGDGVLNSVETANGTDPFNPDTDGDTTGDWTDCFPLDATRYQCPAPQGGDTTPPVITLTEPTNATLISSIPPQ